MPDLTAVMRTHVANGDRLAIVKAPPGSGKTHLLLEVATDAARRGMRVAIAAQTNAQADDICRRLAMGHPDVDTVRFASSSAAPYDVGTGVSWTTRARDLPRRAAVVVGTVMKWGLVDLDAPFDVLFVDEAWQMSWANFMLTGQVSERFVLIGDPGQIAPVVPIPVERWTTSPRAPHVAAPSLILEDPTIPRLEASIDVCRRLPTDAVDLVRPFYDFAFDPLARPGERFVKVKSNGHSHPVDPVLEMLGETSVAGVTLSTDPEGPPFEVDRAIAHVAAAVITRLIERGADVCDGIDEGPLSPEDIGITATHRVMNSAISDALGDLRRVVRVDTPERWQGLERKVMLVIHPLSGVGSPTRFDLETGRLCVMASRHRSGLVVLSRDHVRRTLEDYIPSADQPVGRPDVVGRGHNDHLEFWERLSSNGRVLALSA
jgi:hypothetical protein